MTKYLFAFFLFSYLVYGQGKGEKKIILERPINPNTTYEFGDLHFEKNGKNYWLTTFTAITGSDIDYYRVFEIKQDSGYVKEVTTQLLGAYYPVGGINPPYYYEDIDNDGIKDIIIFDHGKEEANKQPWADYNVFFKGTKEGFVKKELPLITTDKQYYHAHAVADFDVDGDLDIAFSYNSAHIFMNNGKGEFSEMKTTNVSFSEWLGYQYVINNQKYNQGSFGLKFANIDADKELELIIPISDQPVYLDLVNNAWEAKLIGSAKPFQWKENVHIGGEQVLSFVNPITKKTDLVYRIASQKVTPSAPGGKWISLYFKSDGTDYSKISPFKGGFIDTATVYYIDPKIADINFDGFDDLTFKEYDYTQYQNYPCCKYYNGAQLHAVNNRIWLNNGNNDFAPANIKFSDDANKSVYLFVKSDPKLKYNLFLRASHVMNFPIDNDYKTKNVEFYTKIDSLIYPKVDKQKLSLCKGSSIKYVPALVPVELSISRAGKLGSQTIGTNLIAYSAISAGSDTLRYKLKNSFFESPDYELTLQVFDNPTTPSISREGASTLVSSAESGNQWFLNGNKLVGETGQKITANANGLYTVQTTNSMGCLSAVSKESYGLITATNSEPIDVVIAPNPFKDYIKIEFPASFGIYSKVELLGLSSVVSKSKMHVQSGDVLSVSDLASGIYVLKITSESSKESKIVKLVKE
jgi:hypothetical protein